VEPSDETRLAAKLRETEAWLRLFTEHVPVRACATDRDLRVVADLGAGFSSSPGPLGKTVAELFATSPDRDRVLEACGRALEGQPSDLHIDDGQSAARLQLIPRRDADGNVIGVVGLAYDTTKRTRAESALREAQRLLLEAQRIGQVRSWEEDLRTGLVKADLATLMGPAAPLPREEAWKAIPPEERSRMMELRRRTIEEGLPFEIEHRVWMRDGALHTVVTRAQLARDAAGRPERILGTTVDITDRARGEEEVRASRRLLQQVLETLPVGVAVLDRAGNIFLNNPASIRIWGTVIARAEERYTSSKGYQHGTGQPVAPGEWASARALHAGETTLNELIDIDTFDGRRRTIQNSSAPLLDGRSAIVGAVVVNEDVTERVAAEEALRKTERLLVAAERLGETGSWEQDLVTGEIVQSEENRRLFFGDDRSKGARFEDYAEAVHPSDRDWVIGQRAKLIAGEAGPDIEYRVVWPDGSVHTIFGLATVVRDGSGRAVRVYGTNADITRRKRNEEELARRGRQQGAVARLSLAALEGEGLQPLFEEAAKLVAETLGVEQGLVLEWVPEKQRMEFRAGAGGWREDVVRRVVVPTTPGFMAWFYMRSPAPVVVPDLAAETRFAPCELLLAHGVKSAIAAPIGGKQRPFGVLEAAAREPRSFSDDEVHFVWSMASVLATAVEQRRAARELGLKREELQTLSRKLIEAQEAERRAVARELHDDFGQVLTAIKLNLMRKERDEAESIALVDGAIARVRDLAHHLRPPMLDDLGLSASLRWYVDREARRAGLEVHLDIESVEARLPPTVETTCFRVTQEALTNVIRHAQATRIDVLLRLAPDGLRLEVRDDGHGFDVRAARLPGGGQGLLGMRERVALAGGELEIDSAPGRGTVVRARFPRPGSREDVTRPS
jgi:PAS domain S-box-containing protein